MTNVKYASNLDEVQMLHLACVVFSCFVSLHKSNPTNPAEAASSCDALLKASSNLLVVLRRIQVHWISTKIYINLSVIV